MPKRKAKPAPAKRLQDLKIAEVSLVDSPAINEPFLVVKRDRNTGESSMRDAIKKLMESKGVSVEDLAATLEMPVEDLTSLLESEDAIEDDLLEKIASALGTTLDDLKAADTPEAEGEKAADTPEDDPDSQEKEKEEEKEKLAGGGSLIKELVREKFKIIGNLAADLQKGLDGMDIGELQKMLSSMSTAIWSVREDAEMAVMAKRADVKIAAIKGVKDVPDAVELLKTMLETLKSAGGETAEVEKSAGKKLEPDYKSEYESLKKRLDAIEAGGASKTIEGDVKSTKVAKGVGSWSYLDGVVS